MFLNTLGIGEWTARNWVVEPPIATEDDEPCDAEKQQEVPKKQHMKNGEYAREFLDSLPKMPAHYCRKETSKLYLEPVWQSFSELHRVYRHWCTQRDPPVGSVGYKVFTEEIKAKDIGIFLPR